MKVSPGIDPDPVVVLYAHRWGGVGGMDGYGEAFPVSPQAQDPNFTVPIGKAKVEREGKDVTLVAFSRMVGVALKAADELAKEGISAEVLNLRTIRPLDREAINASVRKTSRLVTIEEGWPQSGVGAEICATVVEASYDYLDAPVERICGSDCHGGGVIIRLPGCPSGAHLRLRRPHALCCQPRTPRPAPGAPTPPPPCAPHPTSCTPLPMSCAPLPMSCAPLPMSCAPLPMSCAPLPMSCAPLPMSCAPLPMSCAPLPMSCAPLPISCAPLPTSCALPSTCLSFAL
ncbi:unnamed protein product [Closterium sp. NIES-65]|nr:unnamed protein product [Closterium sp. NIES-65]